MNAECIQALDSLRHTLETDVPLDPEVRAHLGTCLACRQTLGQVLGAFEIRGESTSTLDPGRMEGEVRAQHRRRLLLRGLVLGLFLVAACMGVLARRGLLGSETILRTVVLLWAVPSILLTLWLVRLPGRIGLYKRYSPGRLLSGVCLGLAQRTRTPVELWRGLFVLGTLLHGSGPGLYILLTLVMPVHPEDRVNLLRFRLARWWRGLRGQAA